MAINLLKALLFNKLSHTLTFAGNSAIGAATVMQQTKAGTPQPSSGT
jgi:hypothetical protein